MNSSTAPQTKRDKAARTGHFAHSFRSKNGTLFQLRRMPREKGKLLIDMYLAYQPRDFAAGGSLPLSDQACERWVNDLLDRGIHIVARAAHRPIVGHVALIPVDARKCELWAAVLPEFQNIGIGYELIRNSIDLAGELGFQQIGVSMEKADPKLQHICRKCGFETVSKSEGREFEMTFDWNCRILAIDSMHSEMPRFHFPSVSERNDSQRR